MVDRPDQHADLELLQRLESEATPGPWRTYGNPGSTQPGPYLGKDLGKGRQGISGIPDPRKKDAALIVATRNALLSLLAELVSLRETLGWQQDRITELEAALARAAHVARNLLGMIPRQVWRDQGGDDGQGHYEGDYHAEQVENEIRGWTALSRGGVGHQ